MSIDPSPADTADDRPVGKPSAEMLKALSHPMRWHIMAILTHREDSASGLAREMDEKVDVVSYHVRKLRDLGAIELVRTEARRSSIERFYRAAVRPWMSNEEYAELPVSTRRSLVSPTLQQIFGDALDGLTAGGFDDPLAVAARLVLTLDDDGRREANALLDALAGDLQAVEERSNARTRAAGAEADSRLVEAGLLYFGLPER